MKRDLPEIDERLREWALYFRDRHRWNRTMSIEGLFQPGSDDYIKEGWGDKEKAPTPAPQPRNWILRALEVQDELTKLSKQGSQTVVWAVTYHYAYPHLPKGMVLRVMKKWTGRRLSWKDFLDHVDLGVYRLAAVLR